jgi:aarF domain-containing kinase
VDAITTTITQQPKFHDALYESFARGSYAELDYENEAANQMRFRKELAERHVPVVVPRVYHEWTTERVLTSEWIEGCKLADCPKDQIRTLIPIGVELFLTQLLDIGSFHADPHPGTLQYVGTHFL